MNTALPKAFRGKTEHSFIEFIIPEDGSFFFILYDWLAFIRYNETKISLSPNSLPYTEVLHYTKDKVKTGSFQLKGVDEPEGFRFYLYYDPATFATRHDSPPTQPRACISCKSGDKFVRLSPTC